MCRPFPHSLVGQPRYPGLEPQLGLLLRLTLTHQRLLKHKNVVDSDPLAKCRKDDSFLAGNDGLEITLATCKVLNLLDSASTLLRVLLDRLVDCIQLRVQVFDSGQDRALRCEWTRKESTPWCEPLAASRTSLTRSSCAILCSDRALVISWCRVSSALALGLFLWISPNFDLNSASLRRRPVRERCIS